MRLGFRGVDRSEHPVLDDMPTDGGEALVARGPGDDDPARSPPAQLATSAGTTHAPTPC